jgi:hypothetical protein
MTNDTMKNQICHFTFDRIQEFLMRQLYLITIFTFQLMLINCKDDHKPEFFIDQDTKDFCVFKEGSWWLYEKEGSTERDCVWVKECYENKIDDDDFSYNRNGFEILMFSNWWNKQITCWVGGDIGEPSKNIFRERVTFPLALEDYTFLSTIDSSAVFEPYSGYKLQLSDTLDLFNVGIKIFQDVRIFKVNAGLHQYWQKKIYWSKHIGKIRYESGDGSIWNLIDFNVKQ